jgi:hypothetical protein
MQGIFHVTVRVVLRTKNSVELDAGDLYAQYSQQAGDVRFTPKSGQRAGVSVCPLCAKSSH